ncbi:TPA: fimbria/pilus outer membrane usher protein [Haemophilus influenzae]
MKHFIFYFGLNTPIGAFSADATWSHAEFLLKKVSKNGYSLHGSYSINFNEIGTNLTLAAYRYSSRDFYTLSDTIGLNRTFRQFSGAYLPEIYRPKNQFQVSLSQSLGNWGNLYLSGQTYNYWEKRGTNTQYQLAYANRFHILNYSVNLSQCIDKETGKRDNSIYLSVSLPLGDNHSADSSYSRSGNDINQRLGVNGSFGERYQWSYGINASRNNQGYRSYDANLAHNNSIGSYRASYSRDSLKNRSTSLGASGAVVAHKHGITLSQPVGESFAIIHAKSFLVQIQLA